MCELRMHIFPNLVTLNLFLEMFHSLYTLHWKLVPSYVARNPKCNNVTTKYNPYYYGSLT